MKDFSEVWPGLQSLSCKRLSSNADNFRLVDDFFNRRNDGIADTLRNEAFSEDEDGTTAKPIYDFSCKFMCQQVKGLEDGRNTFFANFNPDEV